MVYNVYITYYERTTMTTIDTSLFDKVEEYIHDAHLIAWDECHKIYLAMDDTEAEWFRNSTYTVVEDTPEVMLATVIRWFEESCFLRFVSAVSHNETDPNEGFTSIIEQFEAEEDEYEEDEEEAV